MEEFRRKRADKKRRAELADAPEESESFHRVPTPKVVKNQSENDSDDEDDDDKKEIKAQLDSTQSEQEIYVKKEFIPIEGYS